MLFNSIQFIIFFIIVVLLYFIIPARFRWILLLCASYLFYMCWKVEYIILIITSTLIDYFAAIAIGKTESIAKKKIYLSISLFSNLGILFFFKYFNFFSKSLQSALNHYSIAYEALSLDVLLPVGISFYTFQTLSYTIEVYKGNKQVEKHFGIFALYVSFFPQLVAGPIERAKNLLPQFYINHKFDYIRVTNGLKLMAWGMFKKVVIADRLALFVDAVYGNTLYFNDGIILIIATVFFAFQVYYDFSGYSDIAIGAAQVLGFNLMENFKRPYFSKSIPEIWERWHISLTSWFRDYVYIPIGGNRVSIPRWFLNILIVFIICGLWHGANWTFVMWGALNGLLSILSITTSSIRKKIVGLIGLAKLPTFYKCFQIILTFSLWCLTVIFFRSNSISHAFYIFTHLSHGWEEIMCSTGIEYFLKIIRDVYGKQIYKNEFFYSIALLALGESVHLMQRKKSIRQILSEKSIWFRWIIYVIVVYSILNYGIAKTIPFIYFQF